MCGPAWRKRSQAKVSLSGDSELGSWKLWRRGFGTEEGVRLCTMCVDWVFVLHVPSLHMSTLRATEKGFWELALGSKLALCRLELAFRGVCFGLLNVFRATLPDISLKTSSKKFGKSGCTLFQSQRLNGWRELPHS